MRTIGWTLACALFIFSLSKEPPCASAESRIDDDKKPGSGVEVARLVPVKNESRVDTDVQDVATFLHDLLQDAEDEKENAIGEGRTFGHKRIQFMLMPMMYKMGVMMTLLTVVGVISLKSLLVGVILLVLKLSTFLAKLHSGWNYHQQPWSPPQPIHVHVHNSNPHTHSHAYAAWEPASGPDDEHYYYKG